MKQWQKDYKRIVIKIGASIFYPAPRKAPFFKTGSGVYSKRLKLEFGLVRGLTDQISDLIKEKKEIVVVSSGAIAFGMSVLGLESRPRDLSYLQACAAIGQHELMGVYRRFFSQKRLNCAQVLLTWEDFDDRRRYLNAKNTLLALLKLKSVPIINENDTVSTAEIKFGDNDRLSALVSSLISADLLINLSDVDGLLDKDRHVIRIVEEITSKIKELACPTDKKGCVGGMITKLEAAKISTDSGIPCVIANGRKKDIVLSVIKDPQRQGTLFLPKKALKAREHWIAFGAKPKGRIIVDDGAKLALMNHKSLLSVGIKACEGDFAAADIVSLLDEQGCEFARGKVNLSREVVEPVKGTRYEKEVVHRDNIVIL